MMPTLSFREAAGRVARRPLPWVLRYLGAAVSAFLVAALLTVPLFGWLSHPLVAEALETRSLDLLVDAMMGLAGEADGGPLLLVGLVLIPIIWVGLRLAWLFLEGGVLVTYSLPQCPTVRGFLPACVTHLASFLLVSVLTFLVVAAVASAGLVGVGAVNALLPWAWPGTVVGVSFAAVAVLVVALAEQARATIVMVGDRNVWHAIKGAGRVAARRFWSLVALAIGSLALQLLLLWLLRVLSGWIPLSWWLLTLLVQQAIQVAITGVGLVRRAGQVALASTESVSVADGLVSE